MKANTGRLLVGIFAMLMASVSFAQSPYDKGWQAFDEHDYELVLAMWLPLADQGDVITQNNVALVYLISSDDDFQSFEQAKYWFKRAAEQGGLEAQTSLGAMYMQGLGVDQDYNRAFEWFYRAANAGYAQAQHNLGRMYAEGLAVSQDDFKAMKWFRRAADQGYAEAELSVSHMLEQGRGIKRAPFIIKDSRWSEFG